MTLLGHPGRVYSVSFSPDGRRLASYGAEGTARVWSLDQDELADWLDSGSPEDCAAEGRRYVRGTDCGPR